MDKCKLCGEEHILRKSHFIPKFVFKWLKETSATGYLRQSTNINLRIQDGLKENLLCDNCEKKFSRFETYFANEFFYPYVNNKKNIFHYDSRLMSFIISLSWRIANKALKGYKKFNPRMYPFLIMAEKYWRNILNNECLDSNFEHHIFFLDYVENAPENIKKENLNVYLLRGTDACIGGNNTQIFSFIKLPHIIFISLINPSTNQESISTKIKTSGKIELPQTYIHPGFDEFLESRLKETVKRKLSDRQKEKILKTLEKNPKRVFQSKTFEAFLENLKHR